MSDAVELRSDRCIVRAPRADDAPNLARHGNNRRVWENLRDRFPHPYTVADAGWYINHVLDTGAPSFVIDVGGEAVGGISLHPGSDVERIGAEIGYWLGEERWGRGIATSAIDLVTHYAFSTLGLERVFALPYTTNVASCHALERAGFLREGTLRHSALKDGVIRDQHMYAHLSS